MISAGAWQNQCHGKHKVWNFPASKQWEIISARTRLGISVPCVSPTISISELFLGYQYFWVIRHGFYYLDYVPTNYRLFSYNMKPRDHKKEFGEANLLAFCTSSAQNCQTYTHLLLCFSCSGFLLGQPLLEAAPEFISLGALGELQFQLLDLLLAPVPLC